MNKLLPTIALAGISTLASAAIGPLPIYPNTEFRTNNSIIGSISSVSSFSYTDISASGANTIANFLKTTGEVTVFDGNIPAYFIRGGNSNHTLVLLDGVKINSADSLNGAIEFNLNTLSLNDIEKIEIIKGNASVLYGSSAIAGVISITTKKGGENTSKVSISTGSDNFKTSNITTSAGDTTNYIRFNASTYETDGISARNTNTETDGQKTTNANIKFGTKINNSNITLGYYTAHDEFEFDDGFGTNHDRKSDISLDKVSLDILTNHTSDIETNFKYAKTNSVKKDFTSGVQTNNSGDKYQTELFSFLNDIKNENSVITTGIERLTDNNVSENIKLSSNDLFVSLQQRIADFDINVGVRYINHDRFGDKTIYNLGSGTDLNNGIRITASYSTAFLAPTLKQLFGWDFSGVNGGGNLDLQPETSKNINFGIEKSFNWGDLSVSLFKNKSNNAIDWIGAGYVNVNKLKTRGIELTLLTSIRGFDINASHTYVKSTENDSGEQALRRPKNTTNIGISSQFNKVFAKLNITKKSSSNDTGNRVLDGYTLLDIHSRYTLDKNTSIKLNINNITNKEYQTANTYNQLGRTFEVGLDYTF